MVKVITQEHIYICVYNAFVSKFCTHVNGFLDNNPVFIQS
jgi:hypothetical protein